MANEPAFHHYERIGRPFHDRLAALIGRGESAVLLCLRDLGKRYALKTLASRLAEDVSLCVVMVNFANEPAWFKKEHARNLIADAVNCIGPGTVQPATDGILDPIRHLAQTRSVVLLASNVDAMGHHIAQMFLREIRVLVSQRKLTAVLTGEENLRDLVYGEDSEFNCAHQFVIQGFDEEEFVRYLDTRLDIGRIRFHAERDRLRELFHATGGNIHLARSALWAWLETLARGNAPNASREAEAFQTFLRQFEISDAFGADVFHHTIRAIERSPAIWPALECLLKDGSAEHEKSTVPTALEFAGLAVRRDGKLWFASPIMESFARRHYDECHMGDLHAINGDWDKALSYYERMQPERRIRPNGTDDRMRLSLVVKALCAQIQMEATHTGEKSRTSAASKERLEKVKGLFARACRMVLGVADVSYWSFNGIWNPLSGQELNDAAESVARTTLKGMEHGAFGYREVPSPTNQQAAVAILPSVLAECRDAVVLADYSTAISRERREMFHELLTQFAIAYDHTIANLGVQLRLEARHQHLEVSTAIVNALGESVKNPKEALRQAGKELLKLGFRRIMFALVDWKERRIRGISDCIGEPTNANMANQTDWSLDNSDKDIQPWVVINGRACVVRDWKTWNDLNPEQRTGLPPMNKVLCEMAGTKPNFAVVPMFIPQKQADGALKDAVFGTIHVERTDGLPPSPEEIEDLQEFGRQMAVAAEQSERVGALHEALRKDADCVVIFDAEMKVRFANRAAESRFDLADWGYIERSDADIERIFGAELIQKLRNVLNMGCTETHQTKPEAPDKTRREAYYAAPLPDWKREESADAKCQRALGVILHVHDLSAEHRVFTALERVAANSQNHESTVSAILESVKDLGYSCARLYLIDPKNEDCLVGIKSLGLDESYARDFDNERYRLERRDGKDPWACIEKKEPLIHSWNVNPEAPARFKTHKGVFLHNLEPECRPPWKRPGDVWIDLPLFANKRPIGKLTIDCGTNFECHLTPEEFELLKLFSVLIGALLVALDKDAWIREAADKAIATCGHKIGTKLAAMDGFADDYADAAPDNAEIAVLNSRYQPIVDDCIRQVELIRDTFAEMPLQREATWMRAYLEQVLDTQLRSRRDAGLASWELNCAKELQANIDAERLGNAIDELICNSRMMVGDKKSLKLWVSATRELRDNGSILRIAIRDNGPGVEKERHEKIFELFHSLRPGGKRSTGLGLNFVRRVVSAHGGRIYLSPKVTDGAEFVIEIPIS